MFYSLLNMVPDTAWAHACFPTRGLAVQALEGGQTCTAKSHSLV